MWFKTGQHSSLYQVTPKKAHVFNVPSPESGKCVQWSSKLDYWKLLISLLIFDFLILLKAEFRSIHLLKSGPLSKQVWYAFCGPVSVS